MTSTAALRPYAYIAGPLFTEGERYEVESLDELVRSLGFDTFLPHRDNPPKTEYNVATIFANDKGAIDRCDVIVANLNGITTDDGTAWELGYAFALGKYGIGLFTDWRARFPARLETVNLMMQCSLHVLARSHDEVRAALSTWKTHYAPR
ncbi:MAG: nucleoside 2-deoxyribosyltransferase [Actinobacteria bacterium]|nr:nucleoside 2-deoxyribosyltransferase [Actinomycetota bacterium]